MTIGIGALASEDEGLRPNRLVLIADKNRVSRGHGRPI